MRWMWEHHPFVVTIVPMLAVGLVVTLLVLAWAGSGGQTCG